MNATTQRIVDLSDGRRTSIQIAAELGVGPRYVRKVQKLRGLPRLTTGSRAGENNHQYVSGRRVDLDGYVLVTAPSDHPYARPRTNRDTKLIFEHRLVLERHLGRYLLPSEIVDHIDGLTLHNAPENLRLFASNGAHLAATTVGRPKRLSQAGREKIRAAHDLRPTLEQVDSYGSRRKSGDVRLRQILLLALSLGADSPFLWGTLHHTTKAGIDLSSRSTTQRALDDLYARWA